MKSFTDVAAGHLKQIVFLKLLEHTSFQLHKLTNRHTYRHTQTYIQTDRQTDRQTHVQTRHLKQIVFLKLLEHTSFQLHKLTNTDTHTDIQTDRHTHVQSYIHIYTAANVAGFPLFCRSPIKGLFKYLFQHLFQKCSLVQRPARYTATASPQA